MLTLPHFKNNIENEHSFANVIRQVLYRYSKVLKTLQQTYYMVWIMRIGHKLYHVKSIIYQHMYIILSVGGTENPSTKRRGIISGCNNNMPYSRQQGESIP